jgi:hypothetical protein
MTSPSGAPARDRRRWARGNIAAGDVSIEARSPPALAGDRRNTRGVRAASGMASVYGTRSLTSRTHRATLTT